MRNNGGLSIDRDTGRTVICCADGSKVYYYRAVMEAELGRPLRSDEHVHHINGDPSDDRIENLEVLSLEEHRRRHWKTHCKRGHEYTPENTYWTSTGYRHCIACRRIRQKRRREKAAA